MVYDPERVVRTAKNGVVKFDDIAIVPLYKDIDRFHIRTQDEFSNSFRAPIYSLHFSVLGSPGTKNATSTSFTVMSNAVLNLKVFTILDGTKVDDQTIDHPTYSVERYYPESNSFVHDDDHGLAKALKIYVGTEENRDDEGKFLSV